MTNCFGGSPVRVPARGSMGRQQIGSEELNAKFFVRIVPTLDFSHDDIRIEANAKVIHVKCLQKSVKESDKDKPYFWCYCADDIFWNRSQEDVYKSTCEDLVDNVLRGVNAVIVAYGQTGSGKSFTVSGLRYHFENRGLILRLLESLCRERDEYQDLKRIAISVSYAEFTRTATKDLLQNKSVDSIKDITKVPVADEIDTWKLLFGAEPRKSFNESAPYTGSHRGHTVFTVRVESVSLVDSHPAPIGSTVHIVDLGGIDSPGSSPSAWRSNSDLGYSNLTKTLMEQLVLCISGRTWKVAGCVCPYKTTKLLDYLHETLQPHCLVRFVGHIFGNSENLPVTLSILRFGEKIKGFKATKLQINILENNPLLSLKLLESDVARLRAELDLNEMLTDSPNYSNLSQERIQQIRRAAKNFLLGNVEKLTLLSLGQAEITLDIFKELYEKISLDKEQAIKEAVLAAIEELQAQMTLDRSFTGSAVSTNQLKTSRRRSSRQHDSQNSVTGTVRSSEMSVIGSRKLSASVVQVGNLDRKGISIGTERSVPNFEGLVTKALKKVRSRKSDVIIRPGPRSNSVKDRGVPTSKDCSSGDSQITIPEKLPSREDAWQEFCLEKSEIVQLYHDEICKLEESSKAARKNYVSALCELGKVRDALDKLKKEWEDFKHIRHIYEYASDEIEEEDDSEEGTKKLYENGIAKKELEMSNAVEYCHVTLTDLRNAAEELTATKAALENEFQTFCSDYYKVYSIPEECSLGEIPCKKSEETVSEDEARDAARMNVYYELQRKMINFTPKKKKQEWITRF